MRKWMYAIPAIFVALVLLGGCGASLEADSGLVYVNKKGIVTSLDVEELDQSYYDVSDLKAFVREEVDGYNAEHGKGTVELKDITVEDDVARMELKYASAADYAAFNGIEFYQGKVVTSLTEGYSYSGEFAKVEDGLVVGAATKQDIYGDEDLKVVIIRANTDVKVEGEIRYVSCENVRLTGKDSVSIRKGYYLENGSGNAASGVSGASGDMSGAGSMDAGGTSGASDVGGDTSDASSAKGATSGAKGATSGIVGAIIVDGTESGTAGTGSTGTDAGTADADGTDVGEAGGIAGTEDGGTENLAGWADTQPEAEEDGSFETDVYTFIVYK